MGSLSFGISELMKAPADGWFKLLTQEEGDFYNVPVPEEGADLADLKTKMRATTVAARRPPPPPDREVPHNMAASDVIRASDFNFIMVLGKGSFGKVSFLYITSLNILSFLTILGFVKSFKFYFLYDFDEAVWLAESFGFKLKDSQYENSTCSTPV